MSRPLLSPRNDFGCLFEGLRFHFRTECNLLHASNFVVASRVPTKCRYHLERYGLDWNKYYGFCLWDMFPVLFRSKVTPMTISLLKMCFLGLRGWLFKRNTYKPYIDTDRKCTELRKQAERSAWADLFHGRQFYQIVAALKTGQWKRITRDSSPVRRKIK